ncbi:unnamed protein product, partial [Ectocarpus sp. 12 AP-2014]
PPDGAQHPPGGGCRFRSPNRSQGVRAREAAHFLPEAPILHHGVRRRRRRAADGYAEEAHDLLGGPAVGAGPNRHRFRRNHPTGGGI